MNTKKNRKKFHFTSQQKKDLQNKIYTWIIFACIVFWTISSVLGIVGFARSIRTSYAETSTTSQCDVVEDFGIEDKTSVSKIARDKRAYANSSSQELPFMPDSFGNFSVVVPFSEISSDGLRFAPTLSLKFLSNYPYSFVSTAGEEVLNFDFTVSSAYCIGLAYGFFDYETYFQDQSLDLLQLSNNPIQSVTFFADTNFTFLNIQVNYSNGSIWRLSLSYMITVYEQGLQINSYMTDTQLTSYKIWQLQNSGYTLGYESGVEAGSAESYEEGYNAGVESVYYGKWKDISINLIALNVRDSENAIITADYGVLYGFEDYRQYISKGVLSFYDLTSVFRQELIGDYPTAVDWETLGVNFSFSTPTLNTDFDLVVEGTSTMFYYPVTVVNEEGVSFNALWQKQEGPAPYYILQYDMTELYFSEIDFRIVGGYTQTNVTFGLQVDEYNAIYNAGYEQGYEQGQDNGYTNGYDTGFQIGKAIGFDEGLNSANDYTFLSLLTSVVDAPFQVFYDMFDFNILGYNMSSFFLALLSACVVLAVLKVILGR